MGNIQTAKRCLEFKGFYCDNKDCLNRSCPLNKVNSQKEPKEKDKDE